MAKRKDIDMEKVRQQATELSHVITGQAHSLGDKAAFLAHEATEWAAPRVDTAKHWVEPRLHEAAEWAEPRIGAAKGTATDKLEKAWRESVKVAAPKVEEVADKARPVVDTAYERVVGDYLPRIQKAMQDAAVAAGAEGTLVEKASGAGTAAEKALTTQPKSHKGTKTLGWILVGSVAAGAGYLLWRRTQPVEDPWAEEYWQDVETTEPAAAASFTEKASEVAHKASDAAKEAAEKASGVAKEAAEKVKHVVEDASHRIEEVAHRKEGAVVGAAEGAAEAVEEAAEKAEEAAEDAAEEFKDRED